MNKSNKPKSSNTLISMSKSYGKHNFIIPDLNTIKRAISYDLLSDKEKHLLLPLNNSYNEKENNSHTLLYESVNIPVKSEWLYEYKERGQTFKVYSGGIISSPSKRINKVYINILNNDDNLIDQEAIDIFSLFINAYYPCLVSELISKPITFEELGIKPRQSDYVQYNAGLTIEKLKSYIPKDGIFIIGLSSMDIYPREEWGFCYGLADVMSGSAVFSMRRHYDEVDSSNKNEISRRLEAIYNTAFTLIHEIGHLLGLKHCIYYNCIIRGLNSSRESYNKFYCPVCMRKLYWNLKLDIEKYWDGLLEMYLTLNKKYPGTVTSYINWLNQRIKLLDNK